MDDKQKYMDIVRCLAVEFAIGLKCERQPEKARDLLEILHSDGDEKSSVMLAETLAENGMNEVDEKRAIQILKNLKNNQDAQVILEQITEKANE